MTRTGSMLVAIGLLLGACGGDDEAPLGVYADECTMTEDCEEGLVCANSVCTTMCGTSPDCTAVDDSGDSICPSDGYCYIACTSNQDCPAHLKCIMFGSTQGTCRP